MNLRRGLVQLGVAVVLLSLLGTLRPAEAAPHSQEAKFHPVLGTLMARGPAEHVDVLVHVERGASGENLARRVGATLKQQWSVAPAVLLSMPAGRINALSAEPQVRWITPDAEVRPTSVDIAPLVRFTEEIQAPKVWSATYTGKGVGIAILDSGVARHADLPDVIAVRAGKQTDAVDRTGHGTLVAGIVGARSQSTGYRGVAPGSQLISVKVLDDSGGGRLSDLLSGLQWVQENRQRFNIRVVNLSLQSTAADYYAKNPLNAAVQALWRSGVVVVAAAGNTGASALGVSRPPANDPYVITVGALDDGGTLSPTDDTLAYFSSHGLTLNGIAKPEVVAPGRQILSTLAAGSQAAVRYPERVVGSTYLTMSGTSASAPMVAGVAALLLEARPDLTPDQVKWLLVTKASRYSGQSDDAGLVNAAASLEAALAPGVVPSFQVVLSGNATASGSMQAQFLLPDAKWTDDPW